MRLAAGEQQPRLPVRRSQYPARRVGFVPSLPHDEPDGPNLPRASAAAVSFGEQQDRLPRQHPAREFDLIVDGHPAVEEAEFSCPLPTV